ncbi:hypothetical protein CANCADRAFT_25710 [Tortispora caseinolytica NRRL Y-17796]|uniref:Cytochrome c oxidase assembly protein CtaG/Cox11 n=1 Tax=Tortispora caseinolytica NRRL Y-17796 TaxID=767744 RepID=A0A1E4TEA0_9ASCO|nr:hypothetical protein CANCADRAFT_25710 [Tortispora caseinolytica NRRL Y-17796]
MEEYEAIRARARGQKVHSGNEGKNIEMAMYQLSGIIFIVGLTYASVPLYKMLCSQMGWAGTPVTPAQSITPDRLVPVENAGRIKVQFSSSVADALPWKFVPEQRLVSVKPGETALAFYKATNKSDHNIVGVATYTVTPPQVAQYFSKIQCFCFEEQQLLAGETVDMPLFFFIDPDFAKDPSMRGIDSVLLHYTFFKAQYDHGGILRPVDDSGNIMHDMTIPRIS